MFAVVSGLFLLAIAPIQSRCVSAFRVAYNELERLIRYSNYDDDTVCWGGCLAFGIHDTFATEGTEKI